MTATMSGWSMRTTGFAAEVNKRCYLDADEVNVGEGFVKLHNTLAKLYRELLGVDEAIKMLKGEIEQ